MTRLLAAVLSAPRILAALAALAAFAAAPVQTCAEGLTVATGGEVTEAAGGKDVVHTFRIGTETKTLTLTAPVYAKVLIVGGGAGSSGYGGGGGAGGLIYREMVLEAGSYDIVVGAGGAAANGYRNRPEMGGESSAFGLVAKGGNYGGTAGYKAPDGGGSAGGASYVEPSGPGYGDLTQGNDGGCDKSGVGGEATCAGGGGGAGGSGQDSWKDGNNVLHGGDGGAPAMFTIYDDTPRYYAAGGGGAGTRNARDIVGGKGGAGADGVSIGGNGADSVGGTAATAGLDDTGSGAGGGGGQGTTSNGAKGGSGIVIVRYTKPTAPPGGALSVIAGFSRVGTSSLMATGVVTSASAAVPVALEWGTAPDAFTGSQELGNQSPMVPFEFSLTGLAQATTYYIRLKTVQGGVTSYSSVRSFTTERVATATVTSAASVVTNGVYEIATFTNGVPGTIVTGGGKFDILVVAGGGAGGGSYGGGGGGGGGVIYEPETTLEAGTYQLLVGAGGKKNGARAGGNGENSSFLKLTELGGGAVETNELFIAIGGGGGGAYDGGGHGPHFGGSAGGGDFGSCGQSKSTYVRGQGNPATGNNKGNQGGGGGGAGSAGKDEVAGEMEGRGGDGGDGRAIDITGEVVYYGAGGGGGGTSWSGGGRQGGYGGLGGGGNGASASAFAVLDPNGRDFVGAGGGGAYDRNQKNGNGGSGVIIVRRYAKDMDDPTPTVSAELLEYGAAYARFKITLVDAGGMGLYPSADISLTVDGRTIKVAEGLASGDSVTYEWIELAPASEVAWSVTADNGTKVSDPVGGTFTTAAAGGAALIVEIVGDAALAGGTNHTATIAYRISWAGEGYQRADLAVEWGAAEAAGYAYRSEMGTGLIGSGTCVLSGLPFGQTLKFRLVATNAGGQSGVSAEGTVEMPEASYVVSPRPFFCVGFTDGNGTISYTTLEVTLFGGNYVDGEGRVVTFAFTNVISVVSGPGVDTDADPHTLTLSAPGEYVIRIRLVNQNGDVFDYDYPLTLIATGHRVCGVVTREGAPAATRNRDTDIRSLFKNNIPRGFEATYAAASVKNLKLDAQTAVRLSSVRVRSTAADLSVWGSNDDENYTLVATNIWGETIADSLKTFPAVGTPAAYRYYRFGRGTETAFDATAGFYYVELLSADLHVETRPPEAWETTAARSPVPKTGVRFPGTLTSPGTPADILVAESEDDWGNDLAAWQAHGRVTTALTGVADGDFVASAVLDAGLRRARVFVRRGETVASGPETYFVRGDSVPMTNLQAYVVGSETAKLKKVYDGQINDICQTGSGNEYYFDLTGNPGLAVTGIRVWPSTANHYYWWHHGTIQVYGARERGDWSAATEMEGSTPEYPKKSIAKADVPELEWELLGDGTFYPEVMRTKQEILFTQRDAKLRKYKMLKVVDMNLFFVYELEPIAFSLKSGLMLVIR